MLSDRQLEHIELRASREKSPFYQGGQTAQHAQIVAAQMMSKQRQSVPTFTKGPSAQDEGYDSKR